MNTILSHNLPLLGHALGCRRYTRLVIHHPQSSIQEWLQQVTPGTPPPTPTVVTSQAVSELPMGVTACGPEVQGTHTPMGPIVHDIAPGLWQPQRCVILHPE